MNLIFLCLLAPIVVLGTPILGKEDSLSFKRLRPHRMSTFKTLPEVETTGTTLKNPGVTIEESSPDSETTGTTLKNPGVTLLPNEETSGTTLKNPGVTIEESSPDFEITGTTLKNPGVSSFPQLSLKVSKFQRKVIKTTVGAEVTVGPSEPSLGAEVTVGPSGISLGDYIFIPRNSWL